MTDRPFDAAAHLCSQFDRTFSLPPADRSSGLQDFVVVEIAGHAAAIATASMLSVLHGTRVVAIPSSAPALLGIAGVRSAIVPVFSLGVLLEQTLARLPAAATGGGEALGSAQPAAVGAWFALCELEGEAAGLAFDRILSYRRVAACDVLAGAANAATAAIRLGDELCPVLDIPFLMRQIAAEAGGGRDTDPLPRARVEVAQPASGTQVQPHDQRHVQLHDPSHQETIL